MDQKNVARLENMIREIIETLSEDMNEADPLCPDSDLSPFRQLIGSLKMELATLRILYPEEPTAPHTEISEIATTQPPELPTTEPLPPSPVVLPHTERIADKPAAKLIREPVLATNELAQTGEDTSLAVNTPSPEASSSAQHGLKSADKASYFNLILASSGLLLALLIGYLFIYHVPQDSQPEKVAANLSEIKKDKKPASGFKNEIGTEQKNKARSIYLLGKMELETQSLSAAREYFRIAVSIDPTNQEYMDAYTQVTNSIQQLSQDK